MLTLLAALAIVPSLAPKIAFVARIYNPPSDQRLSHSQLYVSDIYGKHRRQLTHGDEDVDSVWWISSDAIAWEVGPMLYFSRLKPFHPKRLAAPRGGFNWADDLPRGVLAREDGKRLLPDGSFVLAQREPTQLSEKRWQPGDDISKWTTKDGQTISFSFDAQTLTWHSKGFEFGDTIRVFPCALVGRSLFVEAEEVAGSHGRDYSVYRIDPDQTATRVVPPLGYIDFRIDSAFYAGYSFGGRGIVPYGKHRQVWAAKLYAGDWHTGKRWLVLGGIVYVTNFSIQPEVHSRPSQTRS